MWTLCLIDRLDMSQCFTLGDVTTVNMTMVNGGVAYNVIPAEMDVSFDLRIPPTVNLEVWSCGFLFLIIGVIFFLQSPLTNSRILYAAFF